MFSVWAACSAFFGTFTASNIVLINLVVRRAHFIKPSNACTQRLLISPSSPSPNEAHFIDSSLSCTLLPNWLHFFFRLKNLPRPNQFQCKLIDSVFAKSLMRSASLNVYFFCQTLVPRDRQNVRCDRADRYMYIRDRTTKVKRTKHKT